MAKRRKGVELYLKKLRTRQQQHQQQMKQRGQWHIVYALSDMECNDECTSDSELDKEENKE
eukprot:8488287-Ditylum_brightwellii.AAC.1